MAVLIIGVAVAAGIAVACAVAAIASVREWQRDHRDNT